MSCRMLSYVFGACLLTFLSHVKADINYLIDDGTSEFTLGIDPGEDMIWLNTFPIEPGGEIITAISASYGRPGLTTPLNGLAVSVLLYEDTNGGSPQDAVLKYQTGAIVANANTNVLNVYPILPTEVHGTLLAALLFRNTTNATSFIGAVDRTAPHFADRSFSGFAVGLNEANLLSIPTGQFQALEGFNIQGNLRIRATGRPLPEPASHAISFLVVATCGWRSTRKRI